MSTVDQRRVALVVNDDEKKFIVVIPEEIVSPDQLRNLARNFQFMSNEDCSIVYDHQSRTFRLTQTADTDVPCPERFEVVGHAKAVVKDDANTTVAGAKQSRIPRPPNAWIIYRSRKSKEIRKQLPHATAGYISTVVSKMWKLESRETRLHYNSKAVEAQKLHKEMYPGYKYNAAGKKSAL
uniref:Mating type protein n=1 Tax=Ophiostoma montium TaxID=230073 RepID=M4PIK9_9PEZI|nr:mating type protein [Ophiostoma montium]AGH03263.1 mating type protein [Ophiostoma montium]